MFYISIFIFYMIKIVKADKWDNLKVSLSTCDGENPPHSRQLKWINVTGVVSIFICVAG